MKKEKNIFLHRDLMLLSEQTKCGSYVNIIGSWLLILKPYIPLSDYFTNLNLKHNVKIQFQQK